MGSSDKNNSETSLERKREEVVSILQQTRSKALEAKDKNTPLKNLEFLPENINNPRELINRFHTLTIEITNFALELNQYDKLSEKFILSVYEEGKITSHTPNCFKDTKSLNDSDHQLQKSNFIQLKVLEVFIDFFDTKSFIQKIGLPENFDVKKFLNLSTMIMVDGDNNSFVTECLNALISDGHLTLELPNAGKINEFISQYSLSLSRFIKANTFDIVDDLYINIFTTIGGYFMYLEIYANLWKPASKK